MPAGRAHKEEKKRAVSENEKKEVKPKDLKYAGVQETGLAMGAAKAIEERKKTTEKMLKELE